MIRFVTTAVLLLLIAIPVLADDGPKGTFTAKAPDGTTWSIKLDGKGKFAVLAGEEEMVQGTYKVAKDEIEITDVSGKRAGTGDEKVGTYKFKLDGKKLTFTEVKDKAAGRKEALTGSAWEMKD